MRLEKYRKAGLLLLMNMTYTVSHANDKHSHEPSTGTET